ncbi:MAG: AtuA-related protein [Acidimicrobiia bacterium]
MKVVLRSFCGFRAGDKGDTADVALFAYDDLGYETIVREVTAERVKAHFGSMVTGDVVRYEAPNVRALNFVLRGALGGGGPRSLRSDNLGKSLGGALVRLEVDAPDDLARRPRPDVTWADEIVRDRTRRA